VRGFKNTVASQALRTAADGLYARVIGIIASLALLPVLARSLSTEEFGVYAVLTSFQSLLAFSDLGVGNSLVTQLATEGQADAARRRSLVASAILVAALMSLLLAITGALLAAFLPVADLLGAVYLSEADLRVALLMMILSISATVVPSLGPKILFGLGRSRAYAWWIAAGTSSPMLAAAITSLFAERLLPTLAAYCLTPPLLLGWLTVRTLVRNRIARGPTSLRPSRGDTRLLLRGGVGYVTISLTFSVAFHSDALIISSNLGAKEAATYSAALRLFGIAQQLGTAAQVQLWPLLSRLLESGQFGMARRLVMQASLLLGTTSAAFATVMVLVGEEVIGWWFGWTYTPSLALLIALGLWVAQQGIYGPVSILLNAGAVVGGQAVLGVAMAVANLSLSLLLVRQLGASGPIWSSLLCHTLIVFLPSLMLARQVLRGGYSSARRTRQTKGG
jgi:O-antigen/teichoic acid export membrane protein